MKISAINSVSFKDRQIEEFGETIITSPKTSQLDENKYWLFANKQAQMNKALLLMRIAPDESSTPFQYCIESNDPESDVSYAIKEVKDLTRNIEVTRAIGYKNGSLETHSGWYGMVDQMQYKNDQGLTLAWRFKNWAGIDDATFYPTGELQCIRFGINREYIKDRDNIIPQDFILNSKNNKPAAIHFYKNGNISQELYSTELIDSKGKSAGTITTDKLFDEESGKLAKLIIQYHKPFSHVDEYEYKEFDLTSSIDKLPHSTVAPFDWQSMIPDELQEVIDENLRIAAENRRISIENRSLKNDILELYYDENDEIIDPLDLVLKDGQPFVQGKKLESYRVFQKDLKNNTSREVKYFNGYKFIETRKKDNRTVQENVYGHNTNERALVKKWEDDGKTYYNIARNFRFDTINTPAFLLTKKTPDAAMTVYAELKEKDASIGLFKVDLLTSKTSYKSSFTIKKDGTYDFEAATNQDFEALQKGLIELRALIQADDMKADFGQYKKFNEELDRAIEFTYFVLGNKED